MSTTERGVKGLVSEERTPGTRGRRAMPAQDRRFSVSAFLTTSVYEWAREQAQASGMSLGRYLALLVEERKSRLDEEEEPGAGGPNPP
jgi:hypothetical protein